MSLTGALSRVPLAPNLANLGAESAAARAARYGLVAAWNLADVSDSFGANTLTNNGAATQTTGPDGGGAFQLTAASSQSLSVADNAVLSGGDVDIWWAGFLKFDSLTAGGAFRMAMAKRNDPTNQREYAIGHNGSTNRLFLEVESDGTAAPTAAVVASTFGAYSTATWYMPMGYHQAGADLIGIGINAGAFNTAAFSTGVFDGTATFRLGAHGNAGALFWDGAMAMWYMGKLPAGSLTDALLAEIKTYLYNGGLGRRYPAGWT